MDANSHELIDEYKYDRIEKNTSEQQDKIEPTSAHEIENIEPASAQNHEHAQNHKIERSQNPTELYVDSSSLHQSLSSLSSDTSSTSTDKKNINELYLQKYTQTLN